MINKEKKYTDDLDSCKKSIVKTKNLIAYHKDMLKKLEKKETVISEKLQKVKVNSLFDMLHKGGYDIDIIRSAVNNGDFSGVTAKKTEPVTEDKVQVTDTQKVQSVSEEQTEDNTDDERNKK
jgi:hypothetical protein